MSHRFFDPLHTAAECRKANVGQRTVMLEGQRVVVGIVVAQDIATETLGTTN